MLNSFSLKGQCTGYPIFTSVTGGVNCTGLGVGELCFRATPSSGQQEECLDHIIRFSYPVGSFLWVQPIPSIFGDWTVVPNPGAAPDMLEFKFNGVWVGGALTGCFEFQKTNPAPVTVTVELLDPNNPSPPVTSHTTTIGGFSTIGDPTQPTPISDYIGNELLSVTEAASNGQQIKIEGILEIDESYHFGFDPSGGNTNHIIMSPGARIVVKDITNNNNPYDLGFERTNIEACGGTWDGILLESKASLLMDRSTLSDATVGVEMEDKSSFDMTFTRFIGNDIGIGVFGPGPNSIDFNASFSNSNFTTIENGQTGIHLENVVDFDDTAFWLKLWLQNLNTGIHLDNSNISIGGYIITDCNVGVNEVWGNNHMMFNSCQIGGNDYGIKTVGTSVFTVMNSYFQNNDFDIHKRSKSINETTSIEENDFFASGDFNASGVNVFAQCFGSNLASSISFNQNLHALNYNVHLSAIGKGPHSWAIEDNGMMKRLAGGHKGANVYFSDIAGSSVLENGNVSSTTRNFMINGGGYNGVLQNTAEGAISNVWLNGARGTSVVCNDLSRTAFSGGGVFSSVTGNIRIDNDCGESDIRGNHMSQSNDDGMGKYNLVYGNPFNSYANTWKQEFKGNVFDGSSEGNEKAKNYGPFFLAQGNRYLVDDDNIQGDDHFPFFESAFDEWFVIPLETEDDFVCAVVGGNISHEPTPEVLLKAIENRLVLQDAGLAGFYGNEVAYDSRLKLYRDLVLLDEQDALPTAYDSLYNALSSTDVAPFVDFERTYIQAIEASMEMLVKYDTITTLQAEIRAIKWLMKDSTGEYTIINNQQSVHDQKMAQLKQLVSEHGDLLKAQQVQMDVLLPTLNTLNETADVQPTQSGQNQYEVNKLLLQRFNSGFTEFDSTALQTIITIADQCPINGGEAVHTARSLRTEAEGAPREYDDECVSGQSYMKNPDQGQVATASSHKLMIFPNPASESLTIYLPADFTGNEILITNMFGQFVRRIAVDGNRKVSLGTFHWPNGLYFASTDQEVMTKFIISH